MTAAITQRKVWGIYIAAVAVYFVAVVHRTALGVAGVEALERFNVRGDGPRAPLRHADRRLRGHADS